MQQHGVNLGPTRANMAARGQLEAGMYLANVSPRREHDFYEIIRFTVDTLCKALGVPWEVLGTPWVDVWGSLGEAF